MKRVMMLNDLTVILPTYNEKENLAILVPEILEADWPFDIQNLKVIVVDDNSLDGTATLLKNFELGDPRFSFIIRVSDASLPRSIYDGIHASETSYVAWLDADGSMPIKDLVRFVTIAKSSGADVVIGSRFVPGGGFKGLNEVGKTSLLAFYRNLRSSQDSFLAVILSRALNEFLRLILRAEIRDLTSGFIVARKSYIREEDFIAEYGDYCPILIKRFVARGANMQEVGYLCIPRQFGESKTGSSLYTYIKRGLPYISRSIREAFRKSTT
jgi:dolichol-phosphate mannosyltransferase